MIYSAYDSLNPLEKSAVDSYVEAVKIHAAQNNELIIHALNRQIPNDVIARSRGQLEKPIVLAAIHDKITELAQEQDLSPKRILKEHMHLAMSNMLDYIKFDTFIDRKTNVVTNLPRVDFKDCSREQMAAVKKIKVTHGMFGVDVSLELHSKQSHLEILGRMMGLEEPDNPVYIKHIAAPKDIKPLASTATQAEAERAYTELLEAIK